MSDQQIIDDSSLYKYRHEMPNMAEDDLDPYQYRLYGHYKRIGTTYERVNTTAERTKMSVGMVVKTRDWLAANGWITIEKQETSKTLLIKIVDRWAENMMRYSDNVHGVNINVHQVETKNTTTTVEQRPNIYSIWEQNMVYLTPVIAEELNEMVVETSDPFVEACIKAAVRNNVRKMSYVRQIYNDCREAGRWPDEKQKPEPAQVVLHDAHRKVYR